MKSQIKCIAGIIESKVINMNNTNKTKEISINQAILNFLL